MILDDLSIELQKVLPRNLFGAEQGIFIDNWMNNNPNMLLKAQNALDKLLLHMFKLNASDIDFGAPGCQDMVWYRVFGAKRPEPSFGSISKTTAIVIILSALTVSQKEKLFMRKSLDFAIGLNHSELETRFRGTVYFDQTWICCNFRRINDAPFSMEDLGISKTISDRLNLKTEKKGLVLVTGITGSGKSTTLDAIIDMNNRENDAHIVIIGHPIEYIHESKRCLIRHRDVGVDVLSFEAGAIEALRQDPDIIVVGEMREPRTISTVMEITDSGHKAFSTLHTSSAIDSIHRIVAEFPGEEQERIRNRLADVLSVIISQKLVPTIDGKVIMAKEILSVDSSVKAAIRNKNIGEIYQMMIEGRKLGMMTLEQNLFELYKRGFITNTTAMNFANNKKRMILLFSIS